MQSENIKATYQWLRERGYMVTDTTEETIRKRGCSLMSPLDRDSNGKLPAFAWPGGYPLIYFVADGACICPACANGANGSDATEDPEADKQWRLTACDVYWEGQPLQCEHCNEDIDSAYGDPDATRIKEDSK